MALPSGSRWVPRVIRGAQDRDESFGADVLTYLNSLYALALKLTRDPTTADDLVQDTFLKAVRFAPTFRAGTNRKAWLFTILHNTFRNDRRGASREPVDVDSDQVDRVAVASADDDPERQLLRSVLDADLQAALDALPDAYREAVWLRDVEECSYQEIAAILAIPPGTVMSRISRGRKQLHDRLLEARARASDTATLGAGAVAPLPDPRCDPGASARPATS